MIVRNLPFASYLAIDAAHFSTLKALDISPLHYRHACDNERGDTDALRMGRLAHAMILTPSLPDGVAMYDGPVKRGKAWDAFVAANEGKEIVRRGELNGAMRMREAVMRHPFARRLLSEGDPEVTVQWTTADGIECKGRIDWLRPLGGIVELKTTRYAGKHAFARDFASRLYHVQCALYHAGVLANGKLDSLHVIAAENVPPYDVSVYRIGGDTLDAGRRKVDEWLTRLCECTRARQWPGVTSGECVDMILPEWAVADGLPDVDMSGIEEVA